MALSFYCVIYIHRFVFFYTNTKLFMFVQHHTSITLWLENVTVRERSSLADFFLPTLSSVYGPNFPLWTAFFINLWTKCLFLTWSFNLTNIVHITLFFVRVNRLFNHRLQSVFIFIQLGAPPQFLHCIMEQQSQINCFRDSSFLIWCYFPMYEPNIFISNSIKTTVRWIDNTDHLVTMQFSSYGCHLTTDCHGECRCHEGRTWSSGISVTLRTQGFPVECCIVTK